ncbi:hypothetical protein L1887_57433 [Cichorium endivia]|nr:hypothetical protein L1887_57433 [Cichorium endivia]
MPPPTSTFLVNATIQAGCLVVGGVSNYGNLDFGSFSALSTAVATTPAQWHHGDLAMHAGSDPEHGRRRRAEQQRQPQPQAQQRQQPAGLPAVPRCRVQPGAGHQPDGGGQLQRPDRHQAADLRPCPTGRVIAGGKPTPMCCK